MEWRRDPPPRKEGEYILAIFYHDTGKTWAEDERIYVIYWFPLRKDKDHEGVWVFADYEREDSIDDPIFWMPIEDLMEQSKIKRMEMKWDVMEERTDPFKMFHPSQGKERLKCAKDTL